METLLKKPRHTANIFCWMTSRMVKSEACWKAFDILDRYLALGKQEENVQAVETETGIVGRIWGSC